MANDAAMAKFLYAIIKQLDLKSIDWNKVSEEMTITNGHAARMRYSRFKQQMEGYTPSRRPRNPQMKRGPKQKRPKDEQKAESKIKAEQGSSAEDQAPMNSPENLEVGTSHESGISATPEAEMLKSEPADEAECSQISHYGYSMNTLDMDMEEMQSQILQQVGSEHVTGFGTAILMPPSPHGHGIYQPIMQGDMMDQPHSQPPYSPYPYDGMYFAPLPDNLQSQEQMVRKTEDQWDQSYCQA